MPIQDVGKALVQPGFGSTDPMEELRRFQKAYSELAQQVRGIHDRIQQFGIDIGNGLTSIAVVLAHPTFTVLYCVSPDFSFTHGSHWTSAKTVNGFTLNWSVASVGAQTARILVVE